VLIDAKTVTLAFQKGKANDDLLARYCHPLISRLSRVVAHRLGNGVDPDDLSQEVWLVFQRKIAREFNPEYPIEPILLECARRIGLSMRNSRYEVTETDLDDRYFAGNEFQLENQVTTELDEAEIERRIALDKIEKCLYTNQENIIKVSTNPMLMPGLSFGTHKGEKPQLPKPAKRKPSIATKRVAEQDELISIRNQLNWTQQQFADELGIGVPRLASYEYGKTKGVPDGIMSKARELLTQEAVGAKRAQSKFDGRSMEHILHEWADLLGVPYGDNRDFATAIGASIPTVVRWKNGDTRPSVQGLLRYEKRVLTEASKRK